MTRGPDFDELVGHDLEESERDRLRRAHDALLAAGPPPELPPALESGPTLAMTLGRRPPRVRRAAMLLAAALAVLALAFTAGYITGNGGGGALAGAHTLRLTGTSAAPAAFASLQIEPVDSAGNWPMKLTVTGLPKLPSGGYYVVYLVRNGEIYAPCGSFVAAGGRHVVSVNLNAPYRLRYGDSWVVTKQMPDQHEPGTVVLHPVT